MMFWLICLLMLAVALAMLVRGSRAENDHGGSREAVLATYRQQFADLDRDMDNGVLDESQAAKARLELEHALLAALEGIEKTDARSVKAEVTGESARLFNAFVIVFLSVLSFSLYDYLGEPGLARFSPAELTAEQDTMPAEPLPSIEELVVGLEKRLEQTPDDEKGLWMLVRTYMALGRYSEARQDVEHLYSLSGDEPAVLLLYANVLMLLEDEQGNVSPEQLIERALEIEPANISALWLAGMLAQEKGDTAGALVHWRKLQALVADDAEASEQLARLLEEAEKAAGIVASSEKKNKDAPPGITIEVSIAEELRDKVEEGSSLYVIARADDGLPMPVAVARLAVSDLPLVVVLDDSSAMMPTRLLSAFEQVEVVARISRSGNAIAESGDLASAAKLVQVGPDTRLGLLIEEILP